MCFALAYYLFGLGAGIFGAAIGLVSDVISDVMERRFQAAEDKGSKIFETVEILPCIFIIINFIYAFVILTTAGATQQIPVYTSGFTAKMAQIIPAINNKEFEAENIKEFALQVNHLLSISWFVTMILILPAAICFWSGVKKAFLWKNEFYNFYLERLSKRGFVKVIFALLFLVWLTIFSFESSYNIFLADEGDKKTIFFCSMPLFILPFIYVAFCCIFILFNVSIMSSLKEISSFKKSKIGDKK